MIRKSFSEIILTQVKTLMCKFASSIWILQMFELSWIITIRAQDFYHNGSTLYSNSVANPGFPRGAWAPNLLFWSIFSTNCMKMKKFWPREGSVIHHCNWSIDGCKYFQWQLFSNFLSKAQINKIFSDTIVKTILQTNQICVLPLGRSCNEVGNVK